MAIAKFCPECGTATNDAKFCPECGTSTTVGGGDAQAPPVDASAPPATTTDDDEREIWRGTPDPVLSPMTAKTNSYVITNELVKSIRAR